MRRAITKPQTALTTSRHRDSSTASLFKTRDKVFLITKNFKTRQSTKKLDHVKVGPFLVDKQRGTASYKIRLPTDARIHPVFHISHSWNPQTQRQHCRPRYIMNLKKMTSSKSNRYSTNEATGTSSNGKATQPLTTLGDHAKTRRTVSNCSRSLTRRRTNIPAIDN